DHAMAACADADCVIQEAGGKGWTWNFYKPVIETALKRKLSIVAANVSTADVFKIAREGLAAALSTEVLRDFQLDQPLDAALFDKQKEAIDQGHCHMLPPTAFKGMVNAQVARDVWMAKTVREHAAHGLILLAGNGHVRKDIGVYHWLGSAERARTQALAYTEDEDEVPDSAVFDRNHRVERVERDDPCEAFAHRPQVQT
ncbi:MAG: ChaN family lipoprotein, partial [Rhodoferax sp.]|nr:ChaN family lipoprotein [Rhodoferax sp.]